MSVKSTIERSLASQAAGQAAEIDEARRWLARTEVFLEWIAKNPRLVEVHCEAAHLASLLQGDEVHAVDVDYRGIGLRPKRG